MKTRKTAKRPARRSASRASATRRGGGGAAAGTAKAEGAAPVRAYIASLPAWKRQLARRFDDLAAREVPGVKRAIKWGMPFYGVRDRGWFVSCGAFAECMKVTFFQGASLEPILPSGKGKQLRGIDIRSPGEFDGARLSSWVRQAAKLPGFGS